jgi:hypothetical protein
MLPLGPTVHTRRHCLSPDMVIWTREWETGNDYPAGSKDGHAALKAHRAKCHCQTSQSSKRDAEVAVLDSHFPKDRGIVMKSPSGTNVEVVRSHSRAVAGSKVAARTRAKSAGSAERRMDRRPGVSGEDAGRIVVAAAVPAAGHCWERKDGSWSGIRRQRTGAAESGTGRCMAERLS